MSTLIALGLGGNLAEPTTTIRSALRDLRTANILTDLTVSHFYRTEPWGGAEGGDFINAAACGATKLSPVELLMAIQTLETKAGRTRSKRHYEARTLDIDILLYGTRIVENERLTIPHPHLADRRFVLVPLAEIAAKWVVPTFKTTVGQLLQSCRDTSSVIRINDVSGIEEPS